MNLYKVTLNWSGEVRAFYTHAKNQTKALKNASRQLAKSLNLNPSFVANKFNGSKDNFKITEVKND